jgi:hypothetical protein
MPPKELVEAIRQVHAGRKRIPSEIAAQLDEHIADERLTERELDVLQHVAGGKCSGISRRSPGAGLERGSGPRRRCRRYHRLIDPTLRVW